MATLYSALGEVRVAIVSEITKMHENVAIVNLPYTLEEPKGEYVLIVENIAKIIEQPTDNQLLLELKKLLKTESKQDAFKMLKDKYNLTKSYIYNLYEKNK